MLPACWLTCTLAALRLSLQPRRGYIDNVCQAANEGVNVKGYFAWSLME